MAKREDCLCEADTDVVRGRFAMIVLAIRRTDPTWGRRAVGLGEMMLGDGEPL